MKYVSVLVVLSAFITSILYSVPGVSPVAAQKPLLLLLLHSARVPLITTVKLSKDVQLTFRLTVVETTVKSAGKSPSLPFWQSTNCKDIMCLQVKHSF